MNAVVKILIALALLSSTVHSGPLAYVVCVAGCNTAWAACVAAGGGAAGVSTGGVLVPSVVVACQTAYTACMAGCASIVFTPTP